MQVDAIQARRVLVNGVFVPATVSVDHGTITAIGPYDDAPEGLILRPADSAYVVPGIVDTHVHINEPGRTSWEGFFSATEAAALGGATTLVDMPLNSVPPTTTVEHLRLKQQAATDQLMVDVGFWGGAVPGNIADLEPLWDAGVFGFKCFLADSGVDEFPPLDPEQFTTALIEIARFGGLMIVHAEDARVLAEAPSRPSRSYRDFVLSRPDEAETTAIAQVLDGARETGARVHILHLSSARAVDLIADARAEGLPVTVETCPHYLSFSAETIPDGASQFKCCPPIRDSGNREALWQALRDGIIDMIVSDHSPATAAEKDRGGGDLQQAWGGVSGLQVGFSVLAHEARRRAIPLADLSRWMSTNTADLVGLHRKGRIEIGADADFAVYDTSVELRVEATRLAHRNPISAYDGIRYGGRVTRSVVRGNAIDVERVDHTFGEQLIRGQRVRS
ncbi:MAG: allantoicase [Aeromicrobium sp.]|nr:allantoicase [Aeromicrobium sp.]